MNLYSVDGYWKDDNSEFNTHLFCDHDQTPDGYHDDQIFFYGMSEKDIKQAIEEGEEGLPQCDFVITSYEIYAEDV